uniref:Xylanase inhibitor N-terminal domain-containing protein n=1 Tax=Triticum urartu TaxID=4572 RepID=A0A8R7P8G5_TRIUA
MAASSSRRQLAGVGHADLLAGHELGAAPALSTFELPMQSALDSMDVGMYLVTVHFGTPAVAYSMALDTANDLTWLNCRLRGHRRHRDRDRANANAKTMSLEQALEPPLVKEDLVPSGSVVVVAAVPVLHAGQLRPFPARCVQDAQPQRVVQLPPAPAGRHGDPRHLRARDGDGGGVGGAAGAAAGAGAGLLHLRVRRDRGRARRRAHAGQRQSVLRQDRREELPGPLLLLPAGDAQRPRRLQLPHLRAQPSHGGRRRGRVRRDGHRVRAERAVLGRAGHGRVRQRAAPQHPARGVELPHQRRAQPGHGHLRDVAAGAGVQRGHAGARHPPRPKAGQGGGGGDPVRALLQVGRQEPGAGSHRAEAGAGVDGRREAGAEPQRRAHAGGGARGRLHRLL